MATFGRLGGGTNGSRKADVERGRRLGDRHGDAADRTQAKIGYYFGREILRSSRSLPLGAIRG